MSYFISPVTSAFVRTARENRYLAVLNEDGTFVNLAGRYEYLELPYYVSQDIENNGGVVRPNCRDMLDAYVVPLFLEKAKLAGLPVPEYFITNSYFEPPVIVDSVNPFSSRSRTVLKMSQQKSVAKSITRNFTYAACIQELPPDARVETFRSVLGWCVAPRYRELSRHVWETFGVPLARVRVVRPPDGAILFSRITSLLLQDLKQRETDYLRQRVTWDV